jgi:hypothetical protein
MLAGLTAAERESPAAKSLLDRELKHLDVTHGLLPASTFARGDENPRQTDR